MVESKKPLTRDVLSSPETELIHAGGFANSRVYVRRGADGDWVIKDFAASPWPVRHTIGRYLIGRELRALRLLAGVSGIPADAFRLDRFALAYRYIEGHNLRNAERGTLGGRFFEALESLVLRIHERGLAHLDIRNRKNILVTPHGEPALLDFQSHVLFSSVPRFLSRLGREIDLSGVYKAWEKLEPESLGLERKERLAQFNRKRRFWILAPYAGFRSAARSEPT